MDDESRSHLIFCGCMYICAARHAKTMRGRVCPSFSLVEIFMAFFVNANNMLVSPVAI